MYIIQKYNGIVFAKYETSRTHTLSGEEEVSEEIFNSLEIPCTYTEDENGIKVEPAQAVSIPGQEIIVDNAVIAVEVRAKRNKLLAATDWTQLADSQMDEKAQAAMRAYRQALRDIPQQEGFPFNVEWPALPE